MLMFAPFTPLCIASRISRLLSREMYTSDAQIMLVELLQPTIFVVEAFVNA